MKWLRKKWIRKLPSNFSNYHRMARHQEYRNVLSLREFYKLEVSLTRHQEIENDEVVSVGFEPTLRGKPVSRVINIIALLGAGGWVIRVLLPKILGETLPHQRGRAFVRYKPTA